LLALATPQHRNKKSGGTPSVLLDNNQRIPLFSIVVGSDQRSTMGERLARDLGVPYRKGVEITAG